MRNSLHVSKLRSSAHRDGEKQGEGEANIKTEEFNNLQEAIMNERRAKKVRHDVDVGVCWRKKDENNETVRLMICIAFP